MPRIARILLAATVALVVPALAAAAGYEKTSWGMSLDQVKKLYPGGTRQAEPDGTVSYFVFRKVEGSEAQVGFTFEEGKLVYVAERFPNPRVPIDKKGLNFPVPTIQQAEAIEAKLRKALEAKHGKPVQESAKEDLEANHFIRAAWITADGGTMITLDYQPLADAPHAVVGVSYGKWPPRAPAPENPSK